MDATANEISCCSYFEIAPLLAKQYCKFIMIRIERISQNDFSSGNIHDKSVIYDAAIIYAIPALSALGRVFW